MFSRRATRTVMVRDVPIGGGHPIPVQSMCTTKTTDVYPTLNEIRNMEVAGCDIVRVTVMDEPSARCLSQIREGIRIPLVADIHFNYRIALAALDEGVDKLRINPGNIGGRSRVEAVVTKAHDKRVPIRIGVNAGSLEKDLLDRHGHPTPEGLVESALRHVRILEEMEFHDIVVSLKASRVPLMIEAYRIMSQERDYPLHLGVTEAGPMESGTIKSAIGVGTLLSEGIGDTLRISLAADPVHEVRIGKRILQSLGLRNEGVNVVACPSCGRCEIDLIGLTEKVEEATRGLDKNLTVAVMGCAVNGPGEAREADIGYAGGRGEGLLFIKGQKARKIKEQDFLGELMREIESFR
ncbi:MAG: flavodoxin-dependent (E)-4-hydroxy-3-methylbut-2-enyl-diphosphate synthase [Gemmatimonadetes bacterium]|nr:flavodoxin-dependent (E)-4-hydroxy-3-methylbut-2-enyl-diphosphate synthase [Gemmatimonadota bacterium]